MEPEMFIGDIRLTLNNWLNIQNYSSINVLVDTNTKLHCLPLLALESNYNLVEIKAGEEFKNIDTCQSIWKQLIDNKVDRDGLLINLGGGVITDIGAFTASTYKRGINFVHIPTTLLAQVDAAIGGKTGVDFMHLKNMIGTFSLPQAIFTDNSFLKTLPSDELKSGFAEVIKHSLISSTQLWKEIKAYILDEDIGVELIEKAMNVKQQIVAKDPQEKGLRKILNFGHTVGHAFETNYLEQGNPIKHGEGVAAGIIFALWLSVSKLGFSGSKCDEIIAFISGLYPHLEVDESIINYLQNDKKGAFKFVLLEDIGKPVYDIQCEQDEILNLINRYNALYGK